MGLAPFGPFEEPVAAARRAQLLLAMLLLSLFQICLLQAPPQTHRLILDLEDAPDALPATLPKGGPSLFGPLYSRGEPRVNRRAVHSLEIMPDGSVLFDGDVLDLMALSASLDLISAYSPHEEMVEFRPHPEARYEMFVEVFAIMKRSGVRKLRMPNHLFARVLDEQYPPGIALPDPALPRSLSLRR